MHNLKTASHLNWPKWNSTPPCQRLPDLNLPQCWEPENERLPCEPHSARIQRFPRSVPRQVCKQLTEKRRKMCLFYLCMDRHVEMQASWNKRTNDNDSPSDALSHRHTYPPGGLQPSGRTLWRHTFQGAGKWQKRFRGDNDTNRLKQVPSKLVSGLVWLHLTLTQSEPQQENPNEFRQVVLSLLSYPFLHWGWHLTLLCTQKSVLSEDFMCWLPTPSTHFPASLYN